MKMLPVKDAASCIKMQCKTMYKGACVNQPVHFQNSLDTDVGKSLWRNRLARSAVNRKVGGSSPPRDVICFCFGITHDHTSRFRRKRIRDNRKACVW